MTDAELEVWAEELINLVQEEEQRSDKKLQDMQKSFTEQLPDTLSVRNPRDLFKLI